MKSIKKIKSGDVIEAINHRIKMVAQNDSYIVCNEDGSYYLDEKDGYILHKNKKIAQEIADSLN